jgi:PAS domain S-box-containing protein
MNWFKNNLFKSYVFAGLGGFFLALSISTLLTLKEFELQELEEKEKVQLTAQLIKDRFERVISTVQTAVDIQASLILTNNLDRNFVEIGKNIVQNNDLIDQIQHLDSGVITTIYPLEGNEYYLGQDILKDPNRREEALLTIERNELFFAGPFELPQGGMAITGRLPIFEESDFIGFVSCLIRWEKFKEEILWGYINSTEYNVELFKVDHKGKNPESLLEEEFSRAKGAEITFKIPEGNWIIRVQLINSTAWGNLVPAVIFRIFASLLVGYLIYKFAQYPYRLSEQVKEKTKELSLSNQRFELATQATSEIIWDWDLTNNQIYRSDNLRKILGYKNTNLINQDSFWTSKVHPDDIELVKHNLQQIFESEKNKIVQEYQIKKSDGTYIYVLDKGLVIRNEKGKPIRMIGSTQDITTRKLAEIELEKQKQRLSNVIEGTRAGTWEWNVQTGETRFNEIWANLFGYSLEELDSINLDTWTDLIHPTDIIKSEKILEEYFSGKSKEYQAEYRMKHKNGTWVWILSRGKIFTWTPEGKPLMMFGTLVDISNLKNQEEEIRSTNQKLESANEELKSFASVASHDIKEPLRMISSFLQLLEKRYITQLDEKGLQYIHYAVNGAKRLTSLIENMMEYSKVGFEESKQGPVDLNSVVEEVIQLNKHVITGKNAELKVDDLPIVLGIKTPLKSVFLNLIINALKYQKENNSPKIHIYAKTLGRHCQITIEDNGIGIGKEYYDRIFKLFGRLHRIDEYSGAGIGLAICKKVIDQHQGKIWVESEPGQGTKFNIILTIYDQRTS